MEIPRNLEFTRHYQISDFIAQGNWHVSEAFKNTLPMVAGYLETWTHWKRMMMKYNGLVDSMEN